LLVFLRNVLALFIDSGSSGFLLFWLDACEVLVWRESEDGRPLRLRRGILLWLFRSEPASWLADDMLLASTCCCGCSHPSSLRPCSHGATFVVMSNGVIGCICSFVYRRVEGPVRMLDSSTQLRCEALHTRYSLQEQSMASSDDVRYATGASLVSVSRRADVVSGSWLPADLSSGPPGLATAETLSLRHQILGDGYELYRQQSLTTVQVILRA